MDLYLAREWLTPRSTTGILMVEGQVFYTLELPVRDGLPGSAIPPGRYPIRLLSSPRFMQVGLTDEWVREYAPLMPHIVDIPGRSLIMIHWGNEPDETDGCVLIGLSHEQDFVGSSRTAFAAFYALIQNSAAIDDLWINIKGGPPQGTAPTAPIVTT